MNSRAKLIILALGVYATAVDAQAPCAAGTLASYLTAGYSCTVGGLTFSGFNLVNSKKTPLFIHQKRIGGDPTSVISVIDRNVAADYLADQFQLTPVAPDAGDAGFVLSFPDAVATTAGAGGFGGVDDQESFNVSVLLAFQVDAGIGGLITGGSESLANQALTVYGFDPQAPETYGSTTGELDVADGSFNTGFWFDAYFNDGTTSGSSPSADPLPGTDEFLFGQVGQSIDLFTEGSLYGVYDPGETTSLLSYTAPNASVTPEPPALLLLGIGLGALIALRRRTMPPIGSKS